MTHTFTLHIPSAALWFAAGFLTAVIVAVLLVKLSGAMAPRNI